MKTFLTADPHFSHNGVCKFLKRDGTKLRPWDSPEQMDEALVENWNSVVKPGDKVYVLGDLAINRRGLAVIGRCNGRKVLIKGNHDIFKLKDYTPYFDDIRAYWPLDGMMMSHIPMHPASLARWSKNIHGHLHADRVMYEEMGKLIIDPRYVCVSMEHTNFTPIEFDLIRSGEFA